MPTPLPYAHTPDPSASRHFSFPPPLSFPPLPDTLVSFSPPSSISSPGLPIVPTSSHLKAFSAPLTHSAHPHLFQALPKPPLLSGAVPDTFRVISPFGLPCTKGFHGLEAFDITLPPATPAHLLPGPGCFPLYY